MSTCQRCLRDNAYASDLCDECEQELQQQEFEYQQYEEWLQEQEENKEDDDG